MLIYENSRYQVEIEGTSIRVTNPFGDTYKGAIEDGNLIFKSAIALSYARKAKEELGF